MIEVNLLPGGARTRKAAGPSFDFSSMSSGFSEKLGDKWLIGSVAVMLLAAGIGGWMYFKQESDRAVAEERLAKELADSARYAGLMKARYALEAKRDTLLRQVNLIRAIDDDRFVWPHIMDEVSKALPQYTWLTIMSYGGTPAGATNVVAAPAVKKSPADSAKNKPPPRVPTDIPRDEIVVRMTVRTVDVQALTQFIANLEASPYIGNVYMERTLPGQDQGKELYQSQLIMLYTRPDSTMVRRLPLVVTGR